MKRFASLFAFMLFVMPVMASAQNIGDLLKGGLGRLSKEYLYGRLAKMIGDDAPIASSANEIFPTVGILPGTAFNPDRSCRSLNAQLHLSTNGTVLLPPGDYSIPVTLCCMKHSASSPAGHRYLLARLKGRRAKVITMLNARSSGTELSYQQIQTLSWSLQSGASYDDLTVGQRSIVDRLLPDYKKQIAKSHLDEIISLVNKIAPLLGLGSFEQVLHSGKLGNTGKMIEEFMQFRSTMIAQGDNFDSLARMFITPGHSDAPGGSEHTPFSRINPRVYGRVITSGGAGSTGELQIRVLALPGHTQSNASSALKYCPNPTATPATVDITNIVGEPQNSNIQPLTLLPQKQPDIDLCNYSKLLEGQSPEEQELRKKLYRELLGVMERLANYRENFLNNFKVVDIFPDSYFNTTRAEMDKIANGERTYPVEKMQEMLAFYDAFEYNRQKADTGNINDIEPHWRDYYNSANQIQNYGNTTMSDIIRLTEAGSKAHIDYDLPRAIRQTFDSRPNQSITADDLKQEFDASEDIFADALQGTLDDLYQAASKQGVGALSGFVSPDLMGTFAKWMGKKKDIINQRKEAWKRAFDGKQLPTGDKPQPLHNEESLLKDSQRICP